MISTIGGTTISAIISVRITEPGRQRMSAIG